ncbi:Cysteine-rich receptor-like protein kinase 42 [Hibiscus syriacus]|uniref:Cysteine-rich receptor-like protein kinase 42 n=1 Tax=Hibiscus syriacus TaxID=106335 RepID=A0A6A2YNJ9_HIBSY|nr:cysteine-rich receptor-like protein kinase 42 [Hibiscus syriacus]KAE8680899.1 Cysteine-rich receptor-like protein kinase 42 [Hibiscus syriacus]
MKSMEFSAFKQSHWRWAFLFIFSLFVSTSFSDPRITIAGLFCGNSRAPNGTNYVPDFTEVMKQLSNQINNNIFASYHLNSTPPMYGLAQCHGDLDQTDCLLCYAEARTRIPRCLPRSARIFLDGCFLRYDYYLDFFHESVSSTFDAVNCSSNNVTMVGQDNNSRMILFGRNVDHAVGNVTSIALRRNGFGAVGVDGVYALAQCWESLTPAECRQCLQKAAETVRGCVPKEEGRALNAGCYLRYSTSRFYNEGADSDGHNGLSIGVIIAIVSASSAFLTLAVAAAYATYARLSKRKRELKNLGRISKRFNNSGLKFKYETLEKATDYFSPSRKLGQGGAGSVFMGILPDGKTVAVKRLIYNTRQWVDDFFNEVNLISRIEHKNLVKLLGASIEGPESLLIYEYVPNKSLDQFIFDEEKSKLLNWKQRFDIIAGTAEGLAHLHGEGSPVRIIHRDIKCSNILLDENLNPKIADFGLVRCLATEKSHLSTGIAGTLGYMAPEYLIRGQLSEKADVYSFGVLVLEIVCGKKNSSFTKSGSLLQTVWTLHKSYALAEAVDPCIRDEMSAKEAPGVLQVGLLCTQASVLLRPSMAEVVQMLTDKDYEIPMPNQPPFLNANVLGTATSSGSYSTDSFISNALRKIQGSGTSSESSRTQ